MPALPEADSGRMRPALTSPVPMTLPGGAWAPAAPGGGGVGDVKVLSRLELLEQPASSVPAVDSRPAKAPRRVGNTAGPWKGTRNGISADTAILLTQL